MAKKSNLPLSIAKLTIKYSQVLRKSISGKISHDDENLMLKVKSSLELIINDTDELAESINHKSAKKVIEKAKKELALWNKKFKKGYEERNAELLNELGGEVEEGYEDEDFEADFDEMASDEDEDTDFEDEDDNEEINKSYYIVDR